MQDHFSASSFNISTSIGRSYTFTAAKEGRLCSNRPEDLKKWVQVLRRGAERKQGTVSQPRDLQVDLETLEYTGWFDC